MTELSTEQELALIKRNRAPRAPAIGALATGPMPPPPAPAPADSPVPPPPAPAPADTPVPPPPAPAPIDYAEIDRKLGLPPRETGLSAQPAEDAGFFEVMGSAWSATWKSNFARDYFATNQQNMVSEMLGMLPAAEQDRIRGMMKPGSRVPWSTAMSAITDAAAKEAATPEGAAKWANYPLSLDALNEKAAADFRAQLDEAQAVLDQPGGAVAEFLGSAGASMADPVNLGLSLVAPGSTFVRTLVTEAIANGAAEALALPERYRAAKELGLPDPSPVADVGMGMVFGAGFAGLFHSLGKGMSALKTRIDVRRSSIAETLPPGVDRMDHEAQVDVAEAELRGDQTVQERLAPAGTTPAGRPSEGSLGDVLGKDAFDWTKHRSQGGLREDAISGLDSGFRTSLEGFIASAPPEIRDGLSVFSGFRSIERQQELWDQSDKTGKMVARPGHSKHNHGQAVDIEWRGQRLDKAPREVQDWVAANLEKFGLTRPMDYEPWHIEPIGARGGAAPAPALPAVGPDAPADWARIRNGIFAGESGADPDALFGYQNRKGGKFSHIKPSKMTVDQWIEFQDPNGEYGQWVKAHRPDPENGVATPMGAFQITGTTLRDLKRDLRLKGDEVMSFEFQDYLAQQIYLRQGTGAWQGYKGPRDSYTAGTVDGPAPDMSATSRGYTGQGQVAVGEDTRIDVNYEVVDYRSLIRASGDLQPRDRTRINSDEWVASTAARLDPAQLMPAPTADRGTPIVGPDNVIESGNGRSMAIARAYERHPDRAAAYRAAIEDAGYTIPDGVEQPVLIARRQTDLTPDQRRQLVIDAQDSGVAQMTPTEVARATARNLQAPILSRLDPAQPLASEANGGFVRAALATLPRSARNAMFDPGGALNALGQRQLREAIFARAWPDPDILARYTEGAPAELKSLMEALETAAPSWAALKADIEAGLVTPDMDIGAYVLDAMRLIAAARELAQKQGMPIAKAVAELLDEIDLIEGPISPLTAALVRKMWKGGRAAPADEVASFLTRYADEARKAGQAGGMFDAPGPREVLRTIDPETFKDLPEDMGQARGFATRPTSEAPAEAVRDLPNLGFDQGARSPEVEAVQAEIEARLRGEDGPFGPIFKGYTDKPDQAIAKLLQEKTGEVPDAITIQSIGPVRFVWGSHTLGLRHILEKHGEAVVRDLPRAMREGKLGPEYNGRRDLITEDTPQRKTVVRLDWDGDGKPWVVTSHDVIQGTNAQPGRTSNVLPETAPPSVPDATAQAKDSAVPDRAQAADPIAKELAAARRDLGEFADIEIDLPDGTTARAGDILDDLDADRAADAVVQACATSSNGAAQ